MRPDEQRFIRESDLLIVDISMAHVKGYGYTSMDDVQRIDLAHRLLTQIEINARKREDWKIMQICHDAAKLLDEIKHGCRDAAKRKGES